MANKLTPTTRNNECPICTDVSGKCRTINGSDGEFILCWTNSDARLLEIINGYRCVKQSNGNWATFAPDANGSIDREELALRRQERELAKAREREELAKGALTVEARDKAIRSLHRHFGLSSRHKADLQRRGLSDSQINRRLYFTINPNQEVPFGIPANLPGIKDGQIKAAGPGYACVTFDPQGRATGWQIRLDDLINNKYRWGRGERSSHLGNAELPITSAYPDTINHRAIWTCEGISKPGIASSRLGLVSIGASGANFASSPEQTAEHLKAASDYLGGTKEIVFAPDGGAVSNESVLKAYKRSWELFSKLGYEIKVGWWGQFLKTDADIDELSDLSTVNFVTVADFLSWARIAERDENVDIKKPLQSCKSSSLENGQLLGKRGEIPSSLSQIFTGHQSSKMPSSVSEITPSLTNSISSESSAPKDADSKSAKLKHYIKPIQELPQVGFHVVRQSQDELLERFDALQSKRGQEWLKLRQFTPDKVINLKYFDYEFESAENLAIKSGLGTGKSYFTNAKWLANPDEGAVFGGYRNCLNEQFCANGKKLNGRPWYQIQSDLKGSQEVALIADSQSRIAGAVDSWVYFKPHNFDDKKVIFDEVESVAKHLNQSDTAVSFYRDIVKQRVSNALTNSTANLIADGNLRDFTVEYLEKLSGGRKFTKILNEYTGNRGKAYLCNGSIRKRQATEEDVKLKLASAVGEWISFDYKPDDYSKMHRVMIDLPIDIPLLILSDSQKKCEAWDRELSALGRSTFRLDSTSSGSDSGKLFLQDSRDFILSRKIDTVILSPSAESGVSIELLDELQRQLPGYFKYEFSFFFGVSTTDVQTQFLGRNRDPYTTKFCYAQSHSLTSTRQITESQDSNDVFNGWIETIKDCASLSLEGVEESEVLKLALEKIKEQLLSPHVQYEAKLMLKESFERTHPRLCLEYALWEAGYEVVVLESREDSVEDLRATQEEIALEKATAIFRSEQISSTEADKLARKLNKAPEERHQITKSRLLSRLPGLEEKIVIEEKKISSPEQLQRIEESESEKVVTVANTPYEEWKASSQPIPEKGLEVVVQKPAFNPEFINKVLDKDRYFINRLESQFLLKNPEVCKLIQQHKWHKKLDLLTDPDKGSFGGLPVSRYRSKWLEIHTLIGMGINFFLDPSNSWSDETPEALSFWEKGKIPRIARNIGVSHEDSPCVYIGKILQKYGLRTQEKRKVGPDKSRYREYSIREIDSLSQVVYECVEQRINSQVSEFVFDWKKIIKNSTLPAAESIDTTELIHVHLPPDNLIKTRGEVDVDLSVKASELLHNTSDCDESQEATREPSIVETLSQSFQYCESAQEFALVVKGFEATPEQVEDAIAFASSQPKRKQLEQWLANLQPSTFNLQHSTEPEVQEAACHPPLSSYREGDRVLFYHPDSERKWLEGVVESVSQSLVRVVSGFFGMFVEREALIMPRDWELTT
jgi:hypothetical protein